MPLGKQQADQPQLAQLGPQLGGVAGGVVLELADGGEGAEALGDAGDHVGQHVLFCAEVKSQWHGSVLLGNRTKRGDWGACG